MGPFLSGIQIIGGPLPAVTGVIALVALALLVVRRRPTGTRLRWGVTIGIALLAGAAIGLLLCWTVGDLANAFDVSLSPTSRAWVAVAFAAIGVAVVNIPRSRARRKLGAVAAILCFALVGTLGVNADFGQYTTIGSISDASAFEPLPKYLLDAQRARAAADDSVAVPLWQTWVKPADLPSHGIVGTVTIPATVSHFAARRALVYLPPAALVANPPVLPVLIMLSGQPGSPQHVFLSGKLDTVLDQIAAKNNGLAPIVVVPDQLSAPAKNPMCVDSALGNSATYLTVDVPAWIRANLAVQSDPSRWAIGGFSQGGTCAIQLGAAHPTIFGSLIDVSGELAPKIGSDAATIAGGFAGSAAAYEAAKPLSILARMAPYTDTVAVFGVGSLDAKYAPWIETVSDAARAAGMHTTVLHSPGTSHDWSTVRYTLENGMAQIYRHMGLTK